MEFQHPLLDRPYNAKEVRKLIIAMNKFLQGICTYVKLDPVRNAQGVRQITFECGAAATHRLQPVDGQMRPVRAKGKDAFYCEKHAVRLAIRRNQEAMALAQKYPDIKSPQLKKLENKEEKKVAKKKRSSK